MIILQTFSKKAWGWGYQRLTQLWSHSSGDWAWLAEKPVSVTSLNRSLWRGSVPSVSFFTLLSLSGIIAALGLLANSVATIIGAMIVAPLMGPIIAIAYSIVSGNRRLLRRAGLTLFTGIILTVGISMLITQAVGLNTLGSEVMGRVQPTLMDLGVALAAGAAGAFAKSRKAVADALPGVAIAVALVPPLSVVGIGLAQGSPSVSIGATVLFFTNLVGIIFSGGVVFLCHRYGSLTRAKNGLAVAIATLMVLAIPLGFSLQTIVLRGQAQASVDRLIRTRTVTFAGVDIQNLAVSQQRDRLLINLEVTTPLNSISQEQIRLVKEFLQAELGAPISLKVRIIPARTFES